MSDEHWTTKRDRSDDTLRTWSISGLYAMAEECPVEPADPTICDACAAYLIAQEKEAEPDPSEEEMAFLRGVAAGMSAENDRLRGEVNIVQTKYHEAQTETAQWRAMADDLAADLAKYTIGSKALARYREARGR
jgi:hypothetical protein